MIKLIVATSGLALLFTSCSNQVNEAVAVSSNQLIKHRSNQSWWRQLNDSSLNQDIAAALANNPSLKTIELRSEKAEAAVDAARASTLPRVNLGFGYQEGRRREIDFGPYDLTPWQSQVGLSWEIDVTGKLKAAKNASLEKRNAAIWDIYSARLLLASRISKLRANLYRFNGEISNTNASLTSLQKTIDNLVEQSQAGLIPDSSLHTQQAEVEKMKRIKQELERLRDITVVQIRTLRGGSQPSNTLSGNFPIPRLLSKQPLNKLIASHPTILAAESRVRAAFQQEHSAQLDLLPSFQINLLASGAQKNLADRFRLWTLKAGPSLNIPIYDPVRIANVKSKKAEAKIQAEKYKETVLTILQEIDTARINLASRRAQLATLNKELTALAKSKQNSSEQLAAGVISQLEYLETERSWLAAKRSVSSLRQSVLSAHIDLIKATGGGRTTR